jgi:hypothetical protein
MVSRKARYRFGGSKPEVPTSRKSPVTALESTSPGEDSTGAGAERELGFDPQPPTEGRPSSRRASTKEQGKYWHDTYTPPSRGVARGGAKDPTDGPAELDVLF